MPADLLYFAYGSNLHPARLAPRIGHHALVAAASLWCHDLRFHKLGMDGSGKCDAYRTGDPQDCVLGAIYRISPSDLPRLDRYEGCGQGYDRHVIEVAGAEHCHTVVTYLAAGDSIRSDLVPYDWYKEYVLLGAAFHRFPRDYVAAIEARCATADTDAGRSRAEWGRIEIIRKMWSGAHR